MKKILYICYESLPAGRQGFTLFFAMLVGSLALAVGLSIFDLTLRELDLSSVATQSQYAIYAADTGAECALYWDTKCTIANCTAMGASGSAFATSSTDAHTPTSGVVCNGQDVSAAAVTAGTWPNAGATVSSATTTFKMFVSAQTQASATTTCAIVTVSKTGTPTQTTIVSQGFNTCVAGALQLERVFQVSY